MKFKNYHLREQYPEGFTSTQPHRPRLEAIESEGKEGVWVGSASDKKFFKKEDYRFLYELFRELVEKGIEPLTDDLMHKDEISRLEQEIAALREESDRWRGKYADACSSLVSRDEEHCKDCCCARSWNALGGQTIPGGSIPQHIEELVSELAALREAVREAYRFGPGTDVYPKNGVVFLSPSVEAAARRALEEER